jgi:hypothetical protein
VHTICFGTALSYSSFVEWPVIISHTCYVSGGPLIIPGASASEDIQVGIVAWTGNDGCAVDGSPNGYSRVSNEFNWIKKHICQESSSPPIELCDETSYAPTPTGTTLSPTTTTSTKPSSNPSSSLSPTTSSSPTVVPVEGFSFVGEGYCLDENDNYFAAFWRYFEETDHRVCLEWCAQVRHPNFVGVEIDYWADDFYTCWCDFSGGLPTDIIETDYEPDALGTFYGSGDGPIETVFPSQGDLCYRYEVSLSKLKISCRGCTSSFFSSYCIVFNVSRPRQTQHHHHLMRLLHLRLFFLFPVKPKLAPPFDG